MAPKTYKMEDAIAAAASTKKAVMSSPPIEGVKEVAGKVKSAATPIANTMKTTAEDAVTMGKFAVEGAKSGVRRLLGGKK